MVKTLQMRSIEHDRGRSVEALIRDAVEAGMSLDEVAHELGVTRLTLRDWMRRLQLRVETRRTVVTG